MIEAKAYRRPRHILFPYGWRVTHIPDEPQQGAPYAWTEGTARTAKRARKKARRAEAWMRSRYAASTTHQLARDIGIPHE